MGVKLLCLMFGCGSLGCLCLIASIIMLPIGLAMFVEIGGVNPDMDFGSAGTCTISQLIIDTEESTEFSRSSGDRGRIYTQETTCYGFYTYLFTQAGYTYTSRQEQVKQA
mmetsp:Transcript_67482/g.158937  ORF Transcript_67482/g.158937 Transcript_67482/m.158937 type:complete len:110 (-) Transcript_67482:193-522(-)